MGSFSHLQSSFEAVSSFQTLSDGCFPDRPIKCIPWISETSHLTCLVISVRISVNNSFWKICSYSATNGHQVELEAMPRYEFLHCASPFEWLFQCILSLWQFYNNLQHFVTLTFQFFLRWTVVVFCFSPLSLFQKSLFYSSLWKSCLSLKKCCTDRFLAAICHSNTLYHFMPHQCAR